MSCLIFFILYYTTQITVVHAGGATKSAQFEKVTTPNLSLHPRASYTGLSLVSCARRCQSSVKKRGYFTHNAAQKTCACGVTLLPTPLAHGESLYAPKCNEPGYSLHVLTSARICVKFVSSGIRYDKAEAKCAKDDSAVLFMPDSEEKLEAMEYIIPSGYAANAFIGLDDRDQEGVYRWADGRLVTDELMNSLFSFLSSDNKGSEDCTRFRKNVGRTEAIDCGDRKQYICEIAIE